MGQAEALDHRIGVGERAKQQGEKRVNDQKGQDGEQRQNPRRRHDTAAATRMRLLQRALQRRCQLGQSAPLRAFTEKTESRGSPAGTNRIQGSYWNGGQHGWRNLILRICVGALLVRGKMALPARKLRSNLE